MLLTSLPIFQNGLKITDNMDTYNYPIGADNPDAPWNQRELEPKEVEVTVSITLSKTVKIKVSDYQAEEYKDEDGFPCIDYDFSECNLSQAVIEQVTLPNSVEEFKDWNEDDFEVVLE